MTNDDALPVTVAARSAVDLLWCVLAALVLGLAVVAYETWVAWSNVNIP